MQTNSYNMMSPHKFAILGCGNIGTAIALGLIRTGNYFAKDITLTRRRLESLRHPSLKEFQVTEDNSKAVKSAQIIFVAVEPQQMINLLSEIKAVLNPEKHILISVVTLVTIENILTELGYEIPIVRAMPNTAIAQQESMTCLASSNPNSEAFKTAESIFDSVGKTLIISEELMVPATALGACGIAFFLRSIRAASQGGIEIGFHADDAIAIASQTAKGAATLLLQAEDHPESQIDKVTTPRGCTISGLNQMEHQGFSSAMIKGITTSAEIAHELFSEFDDEK